MNLVQVLGMSDKEKTHAVDERGYVVSQRLSKRSVKSLEQRAHQ